jgi:hypothetical protein
VRTIDIHVYAGTAPDTGGVEEAADHYRQIDVLALPIAWEERSSTEMPGASWYSIARGIPWGPHRASLVYTESEWFGRRR